MAFTLIKQGEIKPSEFSKQLTQISAAILIQPLLQWERPQWPSKTMGVGVPAAR